PSAVGGLTVSVTSVAISTVASGPAPASPPAPPLPLVPALPSPELPPSPTLASTSCTISGSSHATGAASASNPSAPPSKYQRSARKSFHRPTPDLAFMEAECSSGGVLCNFSF